MPIDNARVTSSVPAIAPTIVKSSKGANKLLPNTSAGGDHSTFKVDKDGKIIGYAEYSKNPKNPSGFDQKKRVDVKGGDHHDKKTGKKIPTPHVHEGDDTRPARPDELPNPTPPTPSIPNAAPVTPQPLPTTQP